MRRSGEVLSDTEMAALLGEDTFGGIEQGLERLWAAIVEDADVPVASA